MSLAIKHVLLLLLLSRLSPGKVYKYKRINGFLCIRSDFTRNSSIENYSVIGCAAACSRDQRCQAFSLADGPCQLFVFDKCSKSVRDCSCSRRGHVFVKQQPGLEEGELCPSGYGIDLCGVKYKVFGDKKIWPVQKQRCESESGLVIMTDVTSHDELNHMSHIFNTAAGGVWMWIGGLRTSSYSDWHWIDCNIPVDGSMWDSGEPAYGNAIFVRSLLGDGWKNMWSKAGLCECLSPFD